MIDARTAALVTMVLALGCKGSGTEPAAEPAPAERAPGDAFAAVQPTAPLYERMLAWLDPDTTAAAYVRGLEGEIGALALVFAIPPRPERILRDAVDVVADLEAVLDPDLPPVRGWLGPQALAMAPMVSTGTYVIKPLIKPRAEVEAILTRAEMQLRDVEGFAVYHPSGAFPWKIVFVTDDLVAFVPTREIGHGLGPLTAARDMPASDLRRELSRSLSEDPELALDLVAQGPFLHLDLGQDVIGVRLAVRTWKSGLDANVRLQVADDPDGARKALEARRTPLESPRIQALVERVAFSLDTNVIEGRLQLVADDVVALRGGT